MTYKITFTRPAMIFAGATCASTNSTRYYLHGVQVEPSPEGGVLLVATDGSRLSLGHDLGSEIEGELPAGGVLMPVPKGAVAKLKEGTRAQAKSVTYDGQTFDVDGQTWPAPAIDGTFPDWRRVLPADSDPVPGAGFNARYMADFAKIAAAFGYPGSPLVITGADAAAPHWARLADVPDWRGVIMPMRHSCQGAARPGFV
jgi:DNA polymerase-3 subunit beta